jgi:glycosyltransferase involved in cell wall biosynthesis
MNNPNERLKILFVTSDKFPLFRPAARAIFEEELSKRGHCIDWLLQGDDRHHTEEQWNKRAVIPLGNGTAYVGATDRGGSRWRRLRKHALDLMNDCRMYGLTRSNKYDLIQVKDKYLSALLAIVVAKARRMKFFYWLAFPHAEASIYMAREGIARYRAFSLLRGHIWKLLLYRIILPAADHVFVQSEQMKQDIMAEGIPAETMTPIPGSVDLRDIPYDASNSWDMQNSGGRNEPTVVYLGTLNRMRRLGLILRAFSQVVREVPSAKLYMLGKGDMPEDEAVLRAEVAGLGLEHNVVFTGHLPMAQAWAYIRDADVCLSPYYPTPILLSTSPTKLIEYMAMGKPVVGNDHPEQQRVIRDSGAGICVPWDEAAFAEAILVILNDPAMARLMGQKGRRYVEQERTNRKMADIVEEQYLRICRKRKPNETCAFESTKH